MTETTNKNKKLSSSRVELILIGLGVLFVVFIWVFFPRYLFWKDSTQPEPTKQIVIPYQFDAMLKTDLTLPEPLNEVEEITELQLIGEQFGAFGDSYGSLNTLFSGLAFAMLVASLYLQRKELQAQRLEIEDQKEEIRKSNIIANDQMLITDQQKTLIEQQLHDSKVQNFYTLLFKFLDEKQRKVEEMDERSTNGNFLKGMTHFEKFIIFVEEHYGNSLRKLDFSDSKIDSEFLTNVIHEAMIYANKNTDHTIVNAEYIEYLCFILRFIESHESLEITEDAIKVFISYQSFYEAYVMFIFAIYLEDDELKRYIKKYALLRKLYTFQNENDKENFENLVYFFFGDDATNP